MKKVLSFILVLSMVLGSMGMAFAAPETTQDAIDAMVELGFVQGDEGGLRLDETIRRSEVAVIATRIAGLEDIALKSNYQGVFTDVTPNMWDNPVMNGAINVAAGQGFVKGYPDGTFLPNEDVTNAEIITLMVRLAVTAEEVVELDKGAWPAAYITKAAELGILEGTNVDNFGEAATRETVFVLGYNANEVRAKEGHYSIKVLVLENDRVESIGKDEVVVEVIQEVQQAEFAEKSREEKGDQLRLDLSEFADVEDLLGKVIDVLYNKEGKIVGVKVDETYEYLQGKVEATREKLKVGTKNYTVLLDERYAKEDDRIFRTYLNDAAMSYERFYREPKGAEFARVTVKNGKVIFIDAFDFEDIAPVQEVKKDGEEVFVYNDNRDNAVKKYELKTSTNVIAVNDKTFTKATIADIKANDVIHEYKISPTASRYIVRKDAAVNGTFSKVSKDANGDYVHVDDAKYTIPTAGSKEAVYSYDSKDFYTLKADKAADVLREFRDEKVTVLLDLAGKLQYIGSEIELGEFVAIVTNIVGRDIRVLKQDGTRAEYRATLDTEYRDIDTGHSTLNVFEIGDLVYLSVDGANIDRMYSLGNSNESAVTGLTTRQIGLTNADSENKTDFRILSDTNIFVAIKDKDDIITGYEVRSAKDVADAFEDDSNATAYVISGKVFQDAKVRRVYTGRADEAHTIVFTDINIKSDLNTEVVKFIEYVDRQNTEMKVEYENGRQETYFVPREQRAEVTKDISMNDIIEIKITKDDNEYLMEATRLIASRVDNNVFVVKSYDQYGNMILEDRYGNESPEYYETNDTVIFGNLNKNKKVSYVLEKDDNGDDTKYVRAILVRADNATVGVHDTANSDGNMEGALVFNDYGGTGHVRLGGRNYIIENEQLKKFVETNQAALLKGSELVVNITNGNRIIGLTGLRVTADDVTIDAKDLNTLLAINVTGNKVTLENVKNGSVIRKYAETLTLDGVVVDEVEVIVGGGATLKLKGATKIATITLKEQEKITADASVVVDKIEIKVADFDLDEIDSQLLAKVEVDKANVTVKNVKVTAEVYGEDEVADVTFAVEAEGHTHIEVKVKDEDGEVVELDKDIFAKEDDIVIEELELGTYTYEVKALVIVQVEVEVEGEVEGEVEVEDKTIGESDTYEGKFEAK